MKQVNQIPAAFVKPIEALAKSNDLPNFINDINQHLKTGKAAGFFHNDVGCAVVKPVFDNGRLGLLMWAVVSHCKNGIEQFLPMFLKMAKDSNTEFIEFHSKRPGFKRLAKKIHFTQARSQNGFFVYRREV
jgi:hypothetical protein